LKEEVGRGAAYDCPTSKLEKEEENLGMHASSSICSELTFELPSVEKPFKNLGIIESSEDWPV
jgi:hypothetical protein